MNFENNLHFLIKPFLYISKKSPTGQMYVRGIIVEHSHKIFPADSEKIHSEIPGNIPK